MTATIYYFSGTGNSLHVAKGIASEIEGSSLVNIAGLVSQPSVEDKSDMVGLVFPVYCYDAPPIVKDFIKKLNVDKGAYVFCVATCGGGPGHTLLTVDALLKERDITLSSAFWLEMPDNAYILIDIVTPPAKQPAMLEAADKELQSIVPHIKNKERVRFEGGNFIHRLGSKTMHFALKRLYVVPRKFSADEKCNACGICTKVCPVGNVTRDENNIKWGDNCTWCLACYHWCPQKAVQIGRRSKKGHRYHHPKISVKDMLSK